MVLQNNLRFRCQRFLWRRWKCYLKIWKCKKFATDYRMWSVFSVSMKKVNLLFENTKMERVVHSLLCFVLFCAECCTFHSTALPFFADGGFKEVSGQKGRFQKYSFFKFLLTSIEYVLAFISEGCEALMTAFCIHSCSNQRKCCSFMW